MDYYKSLTQSDLISLVDATQNALYLCMPSIHKEVADAISYLAYNRDFEGIDVGIHLLIDFDAQTFRQGYGDFQSIEDLIIGSFEVKTLKDNRISFIISDDIGYYLFIESRSLIPADKETINAIKIDPVSIVRLKKYFFSHAEELDFEDELTNAIIEESKLLAKANEILSQNIASVLEITTPELEMLVDDLTKNPVLNPDFKRIVEFYSNKFQYVKLKFEGANLKNRKIKLPPKALPIRDATLKKRLDTKLNLFEAEDAEKTFAALEQFNNSVSTLRETFLKKVKSREESIMSKMVKVEFVNAFEDLKNSLPDLKNQTLYKISAHIENTKERLLKELPEFLAENPKALFPDHPNLWENNHEYILQEAKSQAIEIIHRIRWPYAHELVDEFNLDIQFSDITFEDLKNEQFRSDLKECGLINDDDANQLAEFSQGIALNQQ